MTLLRNLKLQEVEPEDANSPLDDFRYGEIILEESIDGESLDRSWGDLLKSDDLEG